MDEIVLVNKAKGSFTINFMGAFPQNKTAAKDGKIYLTEKEYDFVKATFPHILEGETKRLYLESELDAEAKIETNEKFFSQKPAKLKAAIAKMGEEEVEAKYRYAQLQEDISASTIKALEDRILELDKAKE